MLYDPADSLTATGEDLWEPLELEPGKTFRKPSPLFKKLDASIVEEERARLGN
jgi:methionyl-tRNA synthetase